MPRQIVVWDFDETIMRIHAYGLSLTVADVAVRSLEEDVADLPFFRAFVAAVLARGDLVAVASFGRFEVIHAYLERICPGAFSRENISTPSCVGVPDGCSVPQGKTPQLDALLAALLPGGRDAVLFLDDAKHNIDLARAAGYTRSFVIPKGGFTRAAWQAIASSSGEDAVIDSASL